MIHKFIAGRGKLQEKICKVCIKFELPDNSKVLYKQDCWGKHLKQITFRKITETQFTLFLRCQESACATVCLQAVRTCKLCTGSRKKNHKQMYERLKTQLDVF